MKSLKILIVIWLCFSINLFAQEQVLEQKVNLQYNEATLEYILKDLGVRYNLKFSYVNNIIPLSKKITMKVNNSPLKNGLDAILASTDIEYSLVKGQIVLKKNPDKKPVKSSALHQSDERQVEIPKTKVEPDKPEMYEEVVQVSLEKEVLMNSSGESDIKVEDKEIIITTSPETSIYNTEASESSEIFIKEEREGSKSKNINRFFKELFNKEKLSKKKDVAVKEDKKNSKQEKSSEDSENFIEYNEEDLRSFHVGFVYPLSNHSTKAAGYVNKLSVHALVGISKGIDGVETSGLGNIETDFVKGFQAGGIFNVVGGRVEGVQAAGIVNVNGGDVKGAQFAGIANISDGNSESASFSGIGNIVSGDVKGAQFAGIVNVARNADGIQAAGIANITANNVEGIQVAGIFNKSKNIKGTQIGLINIADTVDGVSIGLLNFVKKGYRRFELYGSESFHTNINYKVGVQRFYTILALGAKFQDKFSWGYGLGFGSQLDISQTWKLSIDATSFHIQENNNQEVSFLSMNNNLRIGIDKIFARHFAITFGPSFNVMIRDHTHSESKVNNFNPYTLYESIGKKYTVTMWPGFFVGIRI